MKLLKNLEIVFIVGCQRTGTTLTGNILAAHPNVFMIDEPDGVYPWVHSIFNEESPKIIEKYFLDACLKARLKYQKVDEKCDKNGVFSEQITHLVLKSPNLTYYAQDIARYFNNPKCIFTIRDVRDVVVSMSKLKWIPMVQKQLEFIKLNSGLVERFKPEISVLSSPEIKEHQARAYIAVIKTQLKDTFDQFNISKVEVKYEELTENPIFWIKQFNKHLNLKTPEDNDFTKYLVGWGPGQTYRRNKINTSSIGQWKHNLTSNQEEEIWNVCGMFMRNLGYSRNTEEKESKWEQLVSENKHSPIVATGRGGSGTRLLSQMLQSMNVFLGNQLGGMEDSIEWVNLIYKIST